MAVRVYQIAKEYARSADEVIGILRDSGFEVASHTSVLDEHALHTLQAKLGKYRLTVVEGEDKISPQGDGKGHSGGDKKAKGKKKEPPKPRLKVRVIKKQEADEEEAPKPEVAEEPAPKVEAKPKPKPKPKLRKPNSRRKSIEERIQKVASQSRDDGSAEAPAAEAPAPQAESKPKPAADQQAAPKPPAQPRPSDPASDKPVRKVVDAAKIQAEQRAREQRQEVNNQRRRDRNVGMPPRQGGGGGRHQDGPGGRQHDGPRGQRGPGGPGGQRGPGGPGGQRGPGGPGGQRGPGGPGGGRGPGGPGGPGGQRGPGGPGGRGPGGPGGGRGPGGPGGGRGPGGPGGRGPGGPGGGRGPGGPGGPGGQRGGFGGGFSGGPPPADSGKGPGRFGKNAKPSKKKKGRRRKNEEHFEKIKPVTVSKVELPEEELGIIMLSEGVTVKELAEKVNRKSKDVIKRLFEKGMLSTLNDVLDTDLAIELAKDFGYEADIVSFEEDLQLQEDEKLTEQVDVDTAGSSDDMEERAPIVTIMGHVDHGKTSLLDAIRSTRVASGEAGGITQHIGAYHVDHNGKSIVFLDTPGHEAFTKMRARGTSVTDIVILVVAADDGVKPQTIEAIAHARAAKVPIVVAINKIDKPEANPMRVKQMLTEHELVVEDFGGDVPSVEISAKKRMGLDDLLEMLLLVAELQGYKANPKRRARGSVIESRLDRGRGPVATVIVQDGTLRVGDFFITGATMGKIRAMHDDVGNTVDIAPPSTPVEILGLNEVPAAGESFQVVDDESRARQISTFRKEKQREDQFRRQKHTSLDQLFSKLNKNEIQELPIIIKADVHGSVEGILYALDKLESKKVQHRVVHQGVGNITENDVLLAAASDSIIIGFNVKTERGADDVAEQEQIDIRHYKVIYDVAHEIEAAMLGLLEPETREKEIGKAYVKAVFPASKQGRVAGCYIESGVVRRGCIVRVMRGEDEVYKGEITTLKRFKDDVNEVKSGLECGIGLAEFQDYKEQDLLYFIELEKIKPTQL
jgi:translation initiation factor IF-2